ncbi:hypothetical protein L9F63_019273, partial [Diploptera punctata]
VDQSIVSSETAVYKKKNMRSFPNVITDPAPQDMSTLQSCEQTPTANRMSPPLPTHCFRHRSTIPPWLQQCCSTGQIPNSDGTQYFHQSAAYLTHERSIVQTDSVLSLISNREKYEKEKEYIIKVAIENGYEENMVHKKINKFKRQKLINESTLKKQTEENIRFKKFTYHPVKHHKFQKIFNKFNIRLAPKNEYSLNKIIKNQQK